MTGVGAKGATGAFVRLGRATVSNGTREGSRSWVRVRCSE
jgi:hypothetical protein